MSIRRSERAAFPPREAPAVVFTHDSKSNGQDRRRTLRIGGVPHRASTWRRAARTLFYYDGGGGEVGPLLSGSMQETCAGFAAAAAAADVVAHCWMKTRHRPRHVGQGGVRFHFGGKSAHFACCVARSGHSLVTFSSRSRDS